MPRPLLVLALFLAVPVMARADGPPAVAKPGAFETLVNPTCSHCQDEAKRRAGELTPADPVLAWLRGYSDGGAVPFRFFLNKYPVISDSYGLFVADPDAGFARGFAASYEFRFHGWRNGVMTMRHADGTLFSCLSGVAFDGPRKGERLPPVPTLTSNWGWWLAHYPNAVAYRMTEKYTPVDCPTAANADSVKSRGPADPRLKPDAEVLGVWDGTVARAYPVETLAKAGMLTEQVAGRPLVVFWEPETKTAAAYRPVATPPRKYLGPKPDKRGVSPANPGVPLTDRVSRPVTLSLAPAGSPGRFTDAETHSFWDVAGRAVAGELKGDTLEWADGVQVKWFAWAAEYPKTTVHETPKPSAADPHGLLKDKVKEVAGTAEFLRLLPKPFGTIKALDAAKRTVTLQLDGETEAKVWPLEPDAEVKRDGWWGRLDQFSPGERVWVWLKLNRARKPVSVVMLADAATEFADHASLKRSPPTTFTAEDITKRRAAQRQWLNVRWAADGLPGTLTFHHVFSGELELTLDHEAMHWGRGLKPGDSVTLMATPPIRAVVKAVTPWRERTVVRLVVGELESSELTIGQRLSLKVPTPADPDGDTPPDLDRPRSRSERIDWFLASTYCTCGVSNNTCTGHFYTLASCNPNGCGMPAARRAEVAGLIDRGLTDREILAALVKDAGPLLLRPHLKP
jgi:hypothetical protein